MTSIECIVTIGAAGAVSASSGTLVNSVTRLSTGLYRLNLKGNLNALIGFHGCMISQPSGLSGISSIEALDTSPVDLTSNTAPTFTVKTLDAAGAIADPASGSKVCVQIIGRNSSVSV